MVSGKEEKQGTQSGASSNAVGITNAIKNHIRKGRADKAKELCEKHDVEHAFSESKVSVEDKSGEDSVSSQSLGYSKGESTIGCGAWRTEGDYYNVQGYITLAGSAEVDGPSAAWYADDAFAIVFDSSEWTSPDPTSDNVSLHAEGPYTTDFEDYNPNYGPTATMTAQGRGWQDSALVAIGTELIKRNDRDDIPVKFSYQHNAATAPRSLQDISISAGYLSVDLPFGATKVWKDAETARPSEY